MKAVSSDMLQVESESSQYSHVASGNEDSTVVLQVEMKAVFSVAHTATVYSFAIKKKKSGRERVYALALKREQMFAQVK